MRIQPLIAVAACLVCASSGQAQALSAPPAYSYADLADRVLPAPVAMIATVTNAIRLRPEQAPGLRAGDARVFVEATAKSLIRGPADIPPRIRYLADVRLDAKGRPPKLKKSEMLLLARTVPGKAGTLQLVARDAQLPNSPELERRVRAILTEAVRSDAPPQITGIGGAFHVVGAIPGEGETQIFVSTPNNRPISLNVLRRPGEQRAWSVALSEVVDEAARPPARDTLLWYRLACGLPRALPDDTVAELDAGAAEAARDDYRFVLDQLGACTRNRPLRTS